MKRTRATIVLGFILLLAPLTADASQCPTVSVSLSPGQSGIAVAELQTFLIGLGQLEPGSSTGYYGPLTTAAVQRFQCLQDIVCSGTPQSTGWGSVGIKTRTSISATCTDPKVLGISTNTLTTVALADTSVSSGTGAPVITWAQTLATTTSDGTTGQSFTISWSATGATSCVLQKTTPEGLLTNPWASGVSGSKVASPFKIGMHHFWIDCVGAGGATRQDLYHTVAPSDTRPNIVVIMTDDQDDTGSLSAMPLTKNLIGKSGTQFTNSFVDYSLCCPSRATFLTGQSLHNHRITRYSLFNPSGNPQNALNVWLRNSGYTTALMGKYLNGYDGLSIPPGWDQWMALVRLPYYDYTTNENGTMVTYGSRPEDYQTDVLANRAASFIGQQATSAKPFFLWLTPHAPHKNNILTENGLQTDPIPAQRHVGAFSTLALPRPPSVDEVDVSDKPQFIQRLPAFDAASLTRITNTFHARRESLVAVDEMVKSVVDALQASHKLDNTIIVFTSDNGYSQGEHRRIYGKEVAYDESIRVPLLIRGPGIPTNQVNSSLVSNMDLAATIVEAARVAPTGRIPDGRSLFDLLANRVPWRTALLVQGADRKDDESLVEGSVTGMRTDRYKYLEHTSSTNGSESELYDMQTDPYELENKASDPRFATVVAQFKQVLSGLKTCIGAACFVTTAMPQPPVVSLTQTLATTTSDGTTGQSFTISWSATGATSCVLQKTTPEGLLTNPWASGVSGSKVASPFKIGMHHFWIDCVGAGGATRQDLYHTVTSATVSTSDAYKNLASALQAFLSLGR